MMNRVLIVVSLVLLASSVFLPVSHGAKKPLPTPRKEDVPYIKCQVCEKLASRLHQLVEKKQVQISPKKVSEYEIIEIAENVCNLKKEEADWMLKIDIVEKGNKLVLVEQEEEGMCNSECLTIETACQKVFGYLDTDVAEYIYKSKPDLVSLVNYLCKDLTDACSKKPPPVPKDRIPGEPFVAKPSKDAEKDNIRRSMEGIPGAPGMKIFSKEDIEKYKGNFGKLGNEDGDDDDDDDDEDGNFHMGMPGPPGMKIFSEEDLKEYKEKMAKLGNKDGDDDEDKEGVRSSSSYSRKAEL